MCLHRDVVYVIAEYRRRRSHTQLIYIFYIIYTQTRKSLGMCVRCSCGNLSHSATAEARLASRSPLRFKLVSTNPRALFVVCRSLSSSHRTCSAAATLSQHERDTSLLVFWNTHTTAKAQRGVATVTSTTRRYKETQPKRAIQTNTILRLVLWLFFLCV